VDFEPESDTEKAADKDKFVDSENSDEEEDDELELSDDDEDDFVENKRQCKRLKVGGTKTSKGRKLPVQVQRKRGVSFTDEDSSGKDSDAPSDTDISHRAKKPDKLHQKTVGRKDVFSNVDSHEVRTSGRRRTARNISYAESEESDDSEEKLAKQQKVRFCCGYLRKKHLNCLGTKTDN
jgi:chromodomain-helicase-DNA-binding protein 1